MTAASDSRPRCAQPLGLTRRQMLGARGTPQAPIDVPTCALPRLALPYRDGLIVAGPSVLADGGVGHGTTAVKFVPTSESRMPAAATRLARSADVTAVVVHHRYVPNNRTALALLVSTYLARERAASGLQTDVVTCAARPTAAEWGEFVVVPHPTRLLIGGHVSDEWTVWELVASDHSAARRETVTSPIPEKRRSLATVVCCAGCALIVFLLLLVVMLATVVTDTHGQVCRVETQ